MNFASNCVETKIAKVSLKYERARKFPRKIYEQHCLRRSTLTDELRDGEKSFDWKEVFVQITLGHNFTLTRCIWMCRKNGGQQLAHLSRDFPSQITFLPKKKEKKKCFRQPFSKKKIGNGYSDKKKFFFLNKACGNPIYKSISRV